MAYRQNDGRCDGMSSSLQWHDMALTDTFVRNTSRAGKPAGDKHADGGGMYLLVNAVGTGAGNPQQRIETSYDE